MATRRSSVLSFQLEGVEGPGEEIGSGSYAVVEEYNFMGLSCVGKSIHKDLYGLASTRGRETLLERFEDECEMLSRLRHPNIVQFLGVHFNEGSPLPVLLMERLHSTLTACVDRHGKLPDECCYSVLRDVGVGLRYLHGHTPNPIIHRDLTANNVLVTPDMRAKISDLGVAKILNLNPARMTQLTKCPGTLSYMPPEALVERPIYSTKIDVFSYGNLMTHVFCGRWPIPAEMFCANPSNPHVMTPLTEVQRREAYFNDIGDAHLLMGLMRECLSNNPTLRPDIPEILSRVKEAMEPNERKGADYVTLMQSFTELQQDHATLENELREENAALEKQLSGYMYTGDLKDQSSQDREELAMQYEAQHLELREQLETMTKERDSLLANRERVTAQWEGRVHRLEQQLKAYQGGKTPAEQDHLQFELETMRQKCDAWRQEGEKLIPLRNELQQLQAQISEMEEQCEHLRSNNAGLAKQLQSNLEESEKKQVEMTRKGTNYDILMQRFTELQQSHASLENELGPLREEREAIVREKATLEVQLLGYKAQHLEVQKQLETVMKERDSVLANRERVTAQWEGRIRRLEQQLKAYQEGKVPAKLKSGSMVVKKPLVCAFTSESAVATADTSTVQFMWQPLTEITYPTITLLASFECGSVELSLDPEGSYYSSERVTITKGTYEGQLVIGDGFINPIQDFTVEKDDSTVILQFAVSREEGHGEQGGRYGGSRYGSGYMQRNPSYGGYSNQGYQGTSSYGYGTSGGSDTRYGGGDTRYGGGDTRYGTGDTRYGTGDTRYEGGDTRYGTGDTRYGGNVTRYGGRYTNYGARDTRYGADDTHGGSDMRFGGAGTSFYDINYSTSSSSGSPRDGLPANDFEYHPQYPATYSQPQKK